MILALLQNFAYGADESITARLERPLVRDRKAFGATVATCQEQPAKARPREVIGAELGEGAANIQRVITARCLTEANPSRGGEL